MNNSITLFTVQKMLRVLWLPSGPSELRCDYGTQFPTNYITETVLQEQWCSKTPGPLPLAIRPSEMMDPKKFEFTPESPAERRKGQSWCQPEGSLSHERRLHTVLSTCQITLQERGTRCMHACMYVCMCCACSICVCAGRECM